MQTLKMASTHVARFEPWPSGHGVANSAKGMGVFFSRMAVKLIVLVGLLGFLAWSQVTPAALEATPFHSASVVSYEGAGPIYTDGL